MTEKKDNENKPFGLFRKQDIEHWTNQLKELVRNHPIEIEGIEKMSDNIKDMHDPILPTGLSTIDAMLGKGIGGGFRRGELITITSYPGPMNFGYKSGLRQSLALQAIEAANKEGRNLKIIWPEWDCIERNFSPADMDRLTNSIIGKSVFDPSFNLTRSKQYIKQSDGYRKTYSYSALLVAAVPRYSYFELSRGRNWDYFVGKWKDDKWPGFEELDFSTNPFIKTVIDSHFNHITTRKEVQFMEWRRHKVTYVAKLLGYEDHPMQSMLFH